MTLSSGASLASFLVAGLAMFCFTARLITPRFPEIFMLWHGGMSFHGGMLGVIFAMFIAQAEKAGVNRARVGGTLQNDILKEYQAQKEFVFPPRQSMRLVRDTIAFTANEMPKWHSISISGYHIR